MNTTWALHLYLRKHEKQAKWIIHIQLTQKFTYIRDLINSIDP